MSGRSKNLSPIFLDEDDVPFHLSAPVIRRKRGRKLIAFGWYAAKGRWRSLAIGAT